MKCIFFIDGEILEARFLIDVWLMAGSHFPLNTIRLKRSYIAAAVFGDRTFVPNDYVKENTPFTKQFDTAAKHEAPTKDSEEQDGHKTFHPTVLASCLQTCSTVKEARKVHAVVVKHLRNCQAAIDRNSETFVNNNLISAYLKFGSLVDARKVFDKMSGKNVVSWTAILSGYLKFGLDDEALRLYIGFVDLGIRANSKTFVCLLNLCCRRFDFELGKQIHACLIKRNCSHLIVDSAVLHFYAKFGDLQGAFCIFDRMRELDVVSWTTMISACSQNGWGEVAFTIFLEMLSDGFAPNEFTLCSILKACGEEKRLQIGRQLHAAIVKKICRNDVFLWTSLVDMYAKCGEIKNSRMVFDGMRTRNMVTWTSIISGYAWNGLGEEAINLFRVMKRRNISANKLTMASILRACGLIRALPAGKELHAQIIKNITQSNIHIGSTLVWLYCRCGEYSTACKVLENMPLRDVVSWTAMISGCAHLGHEFEALECLKEMLREGVEPNPHTYSSALKACAKHENIQQGKLIHSSIQKTPALSNVFVGSTLINMYAKCGYVSDAAQVFDSMPERNLVSWKAMIIGYARSGHCREALQLMYRMQAEGIEVDNYVLATVLTACGESDWTMDPSFEKCLQLT
ncbi:hypothetical protein LguiA_006454 [Lonicera macranthoides]